MCAVGVCLSSAVDRTVPIAPSHTRVAVCCGLGPSCSTFTLLRALVGPVREKGGILEHTLSQNLSLLLQLYVFRAAGLQRGYKEEWFSTINH